MRETMKMMRRSGLPAITILINNAAILYHRSFLEHYPDDVERIFNVNVLSHFWVRSEFWIFPFHTVFNNVSFFLFQTIEAVLPAMLQQGKGHIVAINSMCGICGVSQKVPYCSTKFAIRGNY